jgi:hypothetical protein
MSGEPKVRFSIWVGTTLERPHAGIQMEIHYFADTIPDVASMAGWFLYCGVGWGAPPLDVRVGVAQL